MTRHEINALVDGLTDAMEDGVGWARASECARAIASCVPLGIDELADAATICIDHRRRESCYGWPVLDADQAAALMSRVRDVIARVRRAA